MRSLRSFAVFILFWHSSSLTLDNHIHSLQNFWKSTARYSKILEEVVKNKQKDIINYGSFEMFEKHYTAKSISKMPCSKDLSFNTKDYAPNVG